LLHAAIALSLTGRIMLAILLIMPAGILLGMPFPSGTRLISNEASTTYPMGMGSEWILHRYRFCNRINIKYDDRLSGCAVDGDRDLFIEHAGVAKDFFQYIKFLD
jgi:hypothetical protein